MNVKKIKLLSAYCGYLLVFMLATLQTAKAQHTTTQTLDLKNPKTLQAELQINAGTLKLVAHNQVQANTRFTYSRDAWKPVVKYTQQSGEGHLTIKQPEEKDINMRDKERNDWQVTLPQTVLLNLNLRMGAGESNVDLHGAKINRLVLEAGAGEFNLNLAGTSVSDLEVNAGVGEVNLNLAGNRHSNLSATLNGGIGSLNLVLPRQTGVRVKVNGLGGVDNGGLKKKNGYYVNEAYGKTPHSLDITVNGGLGDLQLALEK